GDGVYGHAAFPALINEEINEAELGCGDERDARPHQPFTPAQAALARFREPETQLQCTKLDGVTVAENGLLHGRAVDGGEGVCRWGEEEAVLGIEGKFKVLIPDAIVLQAQVGGCGAPYPKRKMADTRLGARHFAGKNFELNHLTATIWAR